MQKLFIEWIIMKSISTKTSLLLFLYSTFYSLRAGFTKQIHHHTPCLSGLLWDRAVTQGPKHNTNYELKQFDCAELKQFGRGAVGARSVKLRFAPAQEGCSKACLDGEVDVWHGQSAHSSLRSSLPSCALHPKHWNLKQLLFHVLNDYSVSVRTQSTGWKHLIYRPFVLNCTSMFWHGFRCDIFGSVLNLLNDLFVLWQSEGLQKNSQTSPFGNPITKLFENRTDLWSWQGCSLACWWWLHCVARPVASLPRFAHRSPLEGGALAPVWHVPLSNLSFLTMSPMKLFCVGKRLFYINSVWLCVGMF